MYSVPSAYVRNRVKSEPLGFMNYLEIEKMAHQKMREECAKECADKDASMEG